MKLGLRSLRACLVLLAVLSRAAIAQEAPRPTIPPPSLDSGADRYKLTIRGAERRPGRSSAEAIEVVDAKVAREEAGGLSALLDSTKGVVLRQSAGLGSPTTFYLNGLSGNRVRFFVDGVPADVAGLGLSPLDIPVHLIDRVELYKGVVPIRFGTDALGGAVNFVTRDLGDRAFLESSLELASFGTFRGSLVGAVPLWRRFHLYVRPLVFFDRSNNDYPIDVQIANEQGRLQDMTVRRFHDGYQAFGLGIELGVTGLPFADHLSVRVFHSRNERTLQSNVRNTVPYGDVSLGDQATSAILHYVHRDRASLPFGFELLFTYSDRSGFVDDISRNIWNWEGIVIGSRIVPGERGRGTKVRTDSQAAHARITWTFRLGSHSRIELSSSPAFTKWRQNTQSVLAENLPWSESAHSQLKVTSGASWQLRLLRGRLKNDLFLKSYYSRPHGFPSDGTVGNQPRPEPSNDLGAGSSLRLSMIGPLQLSASYEYATRIPDSQELFGDGALVSTNAALRPETSHNVNAGLTLDRWATLIGRFDLETAFFFRRTRDLIFLTVALDGAQYQNISDVDTIGVEGGASWTGFRSLTLSANGTWLNAVSRTTGGFFGRFQGDRIPNQPYLFGNFSASLNLRWIDARLERVRAYWRGHYVHQYFLFWESDGDPTHKLGVPDQFLHNLGISAGSPGGRITATFEVRNIADAKAYNNVGQQLAGRSVHFKLLFGME